MKMSRSAQQEQPGNVGVAPALRADGPKVGVTLSLGFRDCPGSPIGIDFHWGGIIAKEIRVVSFECGRPFQGDGHATYC
jgi:hypothetical protein